MPIAGGGAAYYLAAAADPITRSLDIWHTDIKTTGYLP